MTRKQRAWHTTLWSVLLVTILALFGAALIVRERVNEAAGAVREMIGLG